MITLNNIQSVTCLKQTLLATAIVLLSRGDTGMPHRIFDRDQIFAIIKLFRSIIAIMEIINVFCACWLLITLKQ